MCEHAIVSERILYLPSDFRVALSWLISQSISHPNLQYQNCNLFPRVSGLSVPWSKGGETLVGSGHVSLRICEITIKLLKGGLPKKKFYQYLIYLFD